jgi:hypothetical protein
LLRVEVVLPHDTGFERYSFCTISRMSTLKIDANTTLIDTGLFGIKGAGAAYLR